MTQNNTQQNTDTTLSKQVLDRIDKEKLSPKSKFLCTCSDNGVWILWILTVAVGAVAFAETVYIGTHSGIEYYTLTHTSLFHFVVASLPYVWIGLFLVMVALAYVNMRLTKCGYRYPIWHIIGSSIVFTLIGGFILSAAGVGKAIERMMERMPMPYQSIEERQAYLWAHPEDGRISGVYLEDVAENTVLFLDAVDREWVVTTSELTPEDRTLLVSKKRVRLLGEATTASSSFAFYACGTHPWMYESDMPVEEIRANRARLASVRERIDSVPASTTIPSKCMKILRKMLPR